MRIQGLGSRAVLIQDFDPAETDVQHIGIAHFRHARPPLPSHTHKGAIEFVYVETGTINFCVGKKDFQLNGGQVFVSFPDEVHGTGQLPFERSSYGWVALSLDGPDDRFMGLSFPAALKARERLRSLDRRVFDGSSVLMTMLKRAVDSCLHPHEYSPLVLHSSVMEFITHLLENYDHGKREILSPEVLMAKEYMKNNLTSHFTLDEVANTCGLSLPTFKRRFKKETGAPPYEYLMRLKVLHAAELLKNSTADITDIAYDLGFSSSQHFATAFKKWMSLSPRDYRNNKSATPRSDSPKDK